MEETKEYRFLVDGFEYEDKEYSEGDVIALTEAAAADLVADGTLGSVEDAGEDD